MGRFDIRTRSGLISPIIQGAMGAYTDVDALAFFARVTAAGGTLTLTEQNAIEALVFLLKGRRYNPDFASPNTEEYDLAQRLAVRCSKHHFMTQKCIQFALDFEKFLRSAGDERSAGSFTITTTEDENAVA